MSNLMTKLWKTAFMCLKRSLFRGFMRVLDYALHKER